MFYVEYVPLTRDSVDGKLSKFEQVLMMLIWIELLKISLQQLLLIFGYKLKLKPLRIVNAWMPIYGDVGEHLSILPFINKETFNEKNIEHTKGFFARATEKHISLIWCKYGCLLVPVGYNISGDKGFFGTSGFYANFNCIISPAFLYSNNQFSSEQIDHNICSCQLQYTCEVVYSDVTNCNRLNGFIPQNVFHHFQDLYDWGHRRANLYLLLQMPAK